MNKLLPRQYQVIDYLAEFGPYDHREDASHFIE